MASDFTRRGFLRTAAVGTAGAAAMTAVGANAEETNGDGKRRIVAVSCSPREGKTTATALQMALDAAKEVDSDRIETQLIELAGLEIPAQLAAGLPLAPGQRDDFPSVVEQIDAANLAGLIVGTPVYFSNMSALCKAFLDRCMVFRKQNFALSGAVAGVLAVGGSRNGGQELTIQSVQAALMTHEVLMVGNGNPGPRCGASLWNNAGDDIAKDETGATSAKTLGRRVAETALRLA